MLSSGQEKREQHVFPIYIYAGKGKQQLDGSYDNSYPTAGHRNPKKQKFILIAPQSDGSSEEKSPAEVVIRTSKRLKRKRRMRRPDRTTSHQAEDSTLQSEEQIASSR